MAPRKIKLTQELVDSWLELAWRDGFKKGVEGDDEIPDFKQLLPEQDVSDAEFQSKLPFNPSKCEARILKDGFGVQCSRSPFNGGCMCKKHQDMFDALPDRCLDIPFGRYNKERPTHSLDKPDGGNKIAWNDTKREKGVKKKSQNIKVGELRDYLSTRIPNENFKGMKKAELKELYEKEKAKELIENTDSDSEESTVNPVEEPKEESNEHPVTSRGSPPKSEEPKDEEPKDEKPKDEEPKNEEPKDEEPKDESKEEPKDESMEDPKEEPKEVDNGEGTLASTIPRTPDSIPKTKNEFIKVFDELGIDYSDLKGVRSFKSRYEEYLREKEEKENEDDEITQDMDDLEEDKSNFTDIDFEGVEYLEDEDTAEIYNTKYELVGKWNEDCDAIIWKSKEYEEKHEQLSC